MKKKIRIIVQDITEGDEYKKPQELYRDFRVESNNLDLFIFPVEDMLETLLNDKEPKF